MALNAKEVKNNGGGKKYDPIESGSYPARLVQVIDLGVQPQEFAGEEKAPRTEMMLTYEFLDEFLPDEDGNPNEEKPRWLSETIPLHSLESERAKSTQRYYALDPNVEEDGDFIRLIGKPCNILVTQKAGSGKNAGNIYNNIGGVSAMRPKDAAKAPELVNPPKVFVMDDPDITIFKSLPEWVQDKIKSSLEYKGSLLETRLKGDKGEGSSEKASTAGKARKAPAEDSGNMDDTIPFDTDEGDDNW